MAEHEIAIAIKDIHKDFVLPQHKNTSLKQAAVNIVRKNNVTTQHVLDGISFNVHKGDFFGIVGRNGSGKSTLLKLLAGVYTPTSGSIEVHGGLTPFIELGVGFNTELSGRDNVYLNGALLGFSRPQMDEMYDEIVDFAELGPFMDQKLKNYSSGMQVRLAFSIAVKAKNDILIFDEVLAVGDEAFQRKCLDVFEEYKANRQTVILVTHDMGIVRRFCTQAVLISDGRVAVIGDQKKVADYYHRINQEEVDKEDERRFQAGTRSSHHISSTELTSNSRSLSEMRSGAALQLSIAIHDNRRLHKLVVNLYKSTGEYIIGLAAPYEVLQQSMVRLDMSPRLGIGKHYFTIELFDEKGNLLEDIYRCESFRVRDNTQDGYGQWSGLVAIDHTWS